MASLFPTRRFLVDGSNSKNMAVNGSLVSPIHFTLAAPAGQLITAYDLIFQATGTGTISQPLTEFWDFAALVNGMQIEFSLNGNVIVSPNLIKTNFDLIQYIGAEFLGKIIGTRNVVHGSFALTPPFNLNGDLGDYFRISIRDNLTVGAKIEQMTVSLRGSTIIF